MFENLQSSYFRRKNEAVKGILTLAVGLISYVLFAGLRDLIEGPGEQEYREAMRGLRPSESLAHQVGQLVSRQMVGVHHSGVSVHQAGQLIRAAAEKKHPRACYILAVLEDKGSNSQLLKQCLEGVDGVEVFGNQAGYCLDRVSITGNSTKCDREEEYLRSVPKTVELYEIAVAGGVEQAKTEAESLRKRFSRFKRLADDLRRSEQEKRSVARQKREDEFKRRKEREKAERDQREAEKQARLAEEKRVREEKGYTAHIDSFVGIKFGQPMDAGPFGNNRTDDGSLQYQEVRLPKPVCGICEAVVYGGVKSGKVCKIRLEKPAPFGLLDPVATEFDDMFRRRYGVSKTEALFGINEYRLENGIITMRVMSAGFPGDAKLVIEARQDEAWNTAMSESRAEEDIDLL